MLTIHTTTTPQEDATSALNATLKEAHGKDILLLLSGGSALALLDGIDTSLLGPHVTISVLDERWTYTEADSNFEQLSNISFYTTALASGAQTIDPRPQKPESLVDTAKRFDLALKHWHITHREGVVIATMGIGEDGHTAGILPFPEDPETFESLFTHTTTCVRGYSVPKEKNPHTKRMTVTITYLKRHVDHAVVFAVGENKRAALGRLQRKEGELAVTPARVLREMKGGQVIHRWRTVSADPLTHQTR